MTRRVLVVDDDSAGRGVMALALQSEGHEVVTASSAKEALELQARQGFSVVVTDLNMPGMRGTDLARELAERAPDVPVIVVTAFGSLENAIEAIRVGAYDFLTKPFEVEALALAVERAAHHHELTCEVKRLRRAIGGDTDDDGGLIGESSEMKKLRELLAQIAEADATVLVTGESGTGKEVVARAVHRWSRRKKGPFVAINCAAMPENLLESELFGHVKGAFTDASRDREGLFLQADGGTIFLDEIGDLPIGLQPKLLRALEERTVRPLGGASEKPFDVRVIAATNRDLEAAIEEGRFREDLYYRLNVLGVALPPLRARAGDVLLLGQAFIRRFAEQTGKAVTGISPGAAQRLSAYPWPGNVRELRNCMERAVALTRYDMISVDDLPEKIGQYQSAHVIVAGNTPDDIVPMEEVEKRYILKALEAAGGNKSLAAEKLGLNRKTLYRKLSSYGMG